MPRAYPTYPFIEPDTTGFTDQEIEEVVTDFLSQNPHLRVPTGGALDVVCRALNVDVEYSDIPNDILLEVPLHAKAIIWLPKNGKPRHDRLATACGIGHWLLHVPHTREKHPNFGIQALNSPTQKQAKEEARRFAFAFLMPREKFTTLWYEGRAQLCADELNVPTQAVYDRAKWLALSAGDAFKPPPEPEPEPEPPVQINAPEDMVRVSVGRRI